MKNLSRNVVGGFAMLIAAAILAGMFLLEIPAGNREVALVGLGIALGWAGNVVNFHFGSSEGSKTKTDLMADARANDTGETLP
ncbi:MAG: hypothetical protein ACRCYS_08715 [Beijerinckiaceae bacterium]